VTALVRDDAQADTVAARGATPVVVDLYDRPTVTRLLGSADGAIHAASPGDATSANLDSAVVDAVIDEARTRLGDYFAEVLLLDQGTDAAKARAELGWHPSRPSLTDEFRHGSYRN
jgi:hypothetical protein